MWKKRELLRLENDRLNIWLGFAFRFLMILMFCYKATLRKNDTKTIAEQIEIQKSEYIQIK
jgi:hypothetical protein